MKKLYLFFLLSVFALIGSGQVSLNLDGDPEYSHSETSLYQQPQLKSSAIADPEVVYLRTNTCGDYWGQAGNQRALDMAFGIGGWTRMDYETVNVVDLLSSSVKFIFIDGSNCGTCEFVTFLNSYRSDLEAWVARGGALFLNAASNECTDEKELITGVSLIYGSSGYGVPFNLASPIYNGPLTPALTTYYYGSSWSHEYIVGSDLTVLMNNSSSQPILAEKDYGDGKIMFGGITLEFIGTHPSWTPEPEVTNWYVNVLTYMLGSSNIVGCVSDIVQDNDPGECGAIVTYDQPSAWDTATVTQIDETGFTSGDFFPVDTTVLSYEVDYGDGHVDTCTFSVIVNDVEDPVISCKDLTVVLDSTGYAKLSSSGSGKKVLLLWDTNNASTQSLKTSIEEAGYEVTMPSVPEYQWNNTNPPLDDFDAVVHLDGTTYSNAMSTDAQLALVDFVENQGKVFIHSEWDAYEADDYQIQTQMDDIVILQRYSGDTDDLTYTAVAGQESHPVLENIPSPFTISNVGYSPSYVRSYAVDTAVMLMTDQHGTAAVAVREFGTGRVVGFNHAGNYTNPGALVNENVQQLYVNALNWGTNASSSLLQSVTDNCDISDISLSQSEFGYDDLGDNTVQVTVTDIHGNVSTCASTVTVTIDEDVSPPVAVCSNLYIYDIEALGGTLNIKPDVIDNGSYDNVGIVSYSLSQSSFTCADVGENIITLTIADSSGNVSTCNAVVTINDPNAPVFEAVSDITVDLQNGECETTVDYPEIVANDGCDVTLTQLEGIGPDGGPFPVGTTVEKWEAKDQAGNADTLTFSVIVNSSSTPTIDAIADVEADIDQDSVVVALEGISDLSCLMDGLMVTASATGDTIINSLVVDYVNMDSTGMLTLGLEKGVAGSATVTVHVENSQGGVTEESFMLTIADINDVPTLTYPVDDQSVNAARVLKIPLSSVSGEYFSDAEDITLTLTVTELGSTELPAWATMIGDTLVCEPVLVDSGCVDILVVAADSEGATATDTFTICVDGYVLGIGDVWDDYSVNLYPNPTSGKVNIKFKNTGIADTKIMVYTITGEVVFQKVYRYDDLIQFDMSGKVSGMYLVKMIQGTEIQTRKLILDKK